MSNGKIYMMVGVDEFFYIGHTREENVSSRLKNHKKASKKHPDDKIYKVFTYEAFESNKVSLTIIEELDTSDKKVILERENYHILKNIKNPKCLNTNRAIEDNDVHKQRCKRYYALHKDEINEKKKLYAMENQQSIDEYKLKNRDRILSYNKAYNKIYYTKNKEKIQQNAMQTIQCDCGVSTTKRHLSRHLQSKHHANFVNSEQAKQLNSF